MKNIYRVIVLGTFFCPFFHYAQEQWSLDSCIQYAYQHNLSIQRSALNIQLAAINSRTSLGAMLPSLNGQIVHGYNWGQRIDPFTNQFATQRVRSNNFGVATSVNLFDGFQQINSYRQSLLQEEGNKWSHEKIKNDISLNVAAAYLTLLQSREMEVIARNNVENSNRQADRVRQLTDAGQFPQSTLDEILSQVAIDDATAVSAKNNVMLARLSLMLLLQLNDREMEVFDIVTPSVSDSLSPLLIQNPEAVAQTALQYFPEIKSARNSVESAQLGEQIAKGGVYPRLNASYSYGTGYSGAAQVLSGSPDSMSFPIGQVMGSHDLVLSLPQAIYEKDDYTTKSWATQLHDNLNQSLFFNLTVPLFNGFSTSANIQKAKIYRMDAELQLNQAEQAVVQNVQQAYTDALAAFAAYNATKTSVEAGERAFYWAEKKYEQGAGNFVEYGEAKKVLDNARANLIKNKFDYVFKIKILEFYQGKPISLN